MCNKRGHNRSKSIFDNRGIKKTLRRYQGGESHRAQVKHLIKNPENSPCNHIEKCTHSVYDGSDKKKPHRGSDYYVHIDTQKDVITMEPRSNYIHFETTGKFGGTETE